MYFPNLFRFLFLAVVLQTATYAGDSEAKRVVSRSSVWKYDDSGNNLGTQWRETNFDDTTWPEGNAVLGFGEGEVVTGLSSGKITYYFRVHFNITDNLQDLRSLTLFANYNDGFVAYLNGNEILRSGKMPAGIISYDTPATGDHEGSVYERFVATQHIGTLIQGSNILAVEMHQESAGSDDLVMDLELQYDFGGTDTSVVRGPYLQRASPQSIVIRWRTDFSTDSRVRFGLDPNTLSQFSDNSTLTSEHEVELTGLSPNTRYYYAIGSSSGDLTGGSDYFFVTAPAAGMRKKNRIWILGDSGTANANAAAVRDAYYAFTDTIHTDLWVMLGDNAYESGTDNEYQSAVFEMYDAMLRKSVLWPVFGNHDGRSANSQNESGVFYDIFTLPKNGESGGFASGTEAYYSFEFDNIHFVCLNSEDISTSPSGAMLTWLQNDLASNTSDWTIAFWHHPPYSKGSHNSDTEGKMIDMRENALPILESYGVDLVLSGHSHSYERSFLMDGHYGHSSTLTSEMILDSGDGRDNGDGAYSKPALGPVANAGTVYIVAGSSGKTSGGQFNHPAMYTSLGILGSAVLDVDRNRIDLTFLDNSGNQQDYFTIVKEDSSLVGIDPANEVRSIPAEMQLLQNYPNPFNPTTTIRYALSEGARVNLTVYNSVGQQVTVLVSESQTSGDKAVVWDGRNDGGEALASGVYFYRLSVKPYRLNARGEINGSEKIFVQTRKVLLLK